MPRPAQLSRQAAASLPIVYLTALYGLRQLARLAPGDRILIHAAAGGVGLAAVGIAQQVGAEIFATAGSPEKRAFLEARGIPHVLDSRTLGFAGEVRARTGGRGVDVVLNSLSGELIGESLRVLAPQGDLSKSQGATSGRESRWRPPIPRPSITRFISGR